MIQTVLLHLSRLQRHYDAAVKTYDEISLLDLSHTLRIWADLKLYLPPVFNTTNAFKGSTPPKAVCRLAIGRKHVLAAISGMVDTYAHNGDLIGMPQYPSRKMKCTATIRKREDGALELGSVYIIYDLDPLITDDGALAQRLVGERVSKLNYTQWMGADAVRVGYENQSGKVTAVTISREMLIRRVANAMDGSHPSSATGDDRQGHHYDLPVKYLMEYKIGGLPLPYFLLLKIAQDILGIASSLLLEASAHKRPNVNNCSFQIEISPSLRCSLGVTDLLATEGFLCTALSFDAPPCGLLFSVKSPNYNLACFFDKNAFVLTRNGQEARTDLGSLRYEEQVKLIATVIWEPNKLVVGVDYNKYSKEVSCNTSSTFPPNDLLNWARRQALLPSTTYADELAVLEEVSSQIAHMADRIVDMSAVNSFWDTIYSSETVFEYKPKRVTDILPLIRLLLSPIEILRGLQVVPEHTAGTEKLEFLITGRTLSHKTVRVCVEFKLAHSPEIAHGISVELPDYMSRIGTDYGIYCVIDFGSTHPYEQAKFRMAGLEEPFPLEMMLTLAASKTGPPFLRTSILDVSRAVIKGIEWSISK